MERAPRGEPEQSVLPMGGGRVRLSTTWKDDPEQVEMIEEWQLAPEGPAAANAAAACRKSLLLMRKWRRSDRLKGPGPWTTEIGSPPQQPNASGSGGGGGGKASLMVAENASLNPVWHSRDAPLYWEYVVTNIPYPKSVYSVVIDAEKQQLVLRTSNKKYFKRWSVDALKRRDLTLEMDSIAFAHEGTTLAIRYRKPVSEVAREVEREKDVIGLARGKHLNGIKGTGGGGDTAPECKSS